MSRVPSRAATLAHAAKHAELWNAGRKDEWVAFWRTICPGEVRMFDPVGTQEKHGFDAATSDAFDTFRHLEDQNADGPGERKRDGVGV